VHSVAACASRNSWSHHPSWAQQGGPSVLVRMRAGDGLGGDVPASEGTHVAGPVSLRTIPSGNHIDAGDLSYRMGFNTTSAHSDLTPEQGGRHASVVPVFLFARLPVYAEQAWARPPGPGRT
jgi:hypothetical protein